MKKFLLTVFVLMNTVVTFAQLSGNGYYRIQNYGSERYLYIKDNRGSINIGSTSADLGAIELWKDLDKAVSDPASVVYITKVGTDLYRFHGQGTNSHDIVGHDLKIKLNPDKVTYKAYQSKSGMTKFLSDSERNLSRKRGVLNTNDNQANSPFRKWNIIPVEVVSDHCFGLAPELELADGFYSTFYAEFPFSFTSQDQKAFVVTKLIDDIAIIEELTSNVIEPETPIIVKCGSANPRDNKLDLHDFKPAPANKTLLKGNYFCYPRPGSHQHVTPYNPETMRMLTVSAEGKLVFAKSDIEYLPSNRAYLPVAKGSADVIRVMTQAEYDQVTGIENVAAGVVADQKVYSLSGTVVGDSKAALKTLPAGVYIVAGKKYIVK